jgi:hypothetical protein
MEATISFTPMPISDIKFQHGEDFLVYAPLDDITGLELANMMHLFTIATLQSSNNGWYLYDYPEFIERKRLMRHFKKEPK